MSVSVKAFLETPDGKPEIRRFPVEANVIHSYSAFVQKLISVFPAVQQKNIVTYWKDEEGDEIIVSSDEELKYMFDISKTDVFKIYVRVAPNQENDSDGNGEGDIHPNVVCDGCNGDIRGCRFKCLQCPDYDLCSSCEAKGTHVEHNMLRIASPLQTPHYFGRHKWWMGGRGHHGCGRRSERHGHHHRRKSKEEAATDGEQETSGPELQPNFFFERFLSALSGMGMTEAPKEGTQETRNNGGQDLLRNIGETVAAMLDPLGIDVTVDIEHKGQTERCGEKSKTPETETKEPEAQPGPSATGRDTETGIQEDSPKAPETATEHNKEQQPMEAEKLSSDANTMDVDDWTYIANGEHLADKPDTNTTKDKPMESNSSSEKLHPDPKIAKSLEQMLSMGFNNDGEWLTHLLELKDGDIGKVLDVLQPAKQMF